MHRKPPGLCVSKSIQDLAYMLIEYKSRRLTGSNELGLPPKTVRNIWITFSGFFR